ncbi:hypothetical protein ACFL52_02960 [Candidatus Margulisiibacteriota bacterium]
MVSTNLSIGIRTLAWGMRTKYVRSIVEGVSNNVGRVMTTRAGQVATKALLGREYDLYGARTRAGCYNIAKRHMALPEEQQAKDIFSITAVPTIAIYSETCE